MGSGGDGQARAERLAARVAAGRLSPPSRAFLEYYQEPLEYACPTEDIYLE